MSDIINYREEAIAIVEAIRKWSHFLQGHRFKIVTNQKSVLLMYDNKRRSKVKTDKILRWRLELSQYDYEIIYKAEKYYSVPNTPRAYCASVSKSSFYEIHIALCHSGVTRFYHSLH